MNKVYLFMAIMACLNISFSQKENFNPERSVQDLKTEISRINNQLRKITKDMESIGSASKQNENNISQIKNSLNNLTDNVNTINSSLDIKITQTGKRNENQIEELGGDLEKTRLYWIIATLVTLLLGAMMYLFLGKRIKSSKMDVETQIRNTKKSLEEESLKLDGELVKVFQKQLEVLETTPKETTKDDDHTLVLRIADRLTAMETNHYRMDPNTRGLKQLKNAVKSIRENYLAKGYEIVEMLELEYKEGMNVTANFIPSDKIEKGKRIITRVIKPQVNFNGKMIQAAQIEVSVGE